MTTRQLSIKSRSYYFYNGLINILNFENLNYIGYVDKKPEWNVNSVNSLYLMINRVYGTISEKTAINT